MEGGVPTRSERVLVTLFICSESTCLWVRSIWLRLRRSWRFQPPVPMWWRMVELPPRLALPTSSSQRRCTSVASRTMSLIRNSTAFLASSGRWCRSVSAGTSPHGIDSGMHTSTSTTRMMRPVLLKCWSWLLRMGRPFGSCIQTVTLQSLKVGRPTYLSRVLTKQMLLLSELKSFCLPLESSYHNQLQRWLCR